MTPEETRTRPVGVTLAGKVGLTPGSVGCRGLLAAMAGTGWLPTRVCGSEVNAEELADVLETGAAEVLETGAVGSVVAGAGFEERAGAGVPAKDLGRTLPDAGGGVLVAGAVNADLL